jgi:peptide/nickel transport system substrate-binding protein
MAKELSGYDVTLSRRALLGATSIALTGAAVYGLARPADASQRHHKRGGTLRFATRGDSNGLDPHRNLMYLVSEPLAATTQGLLDLNLKCEPVPGIATAWEASKDLLTYTFKLRKGAQFHNGREIDAAAVKWNFERIQNPQTSGAFTRSALSDLKETVLIDKHTVQCHLHQPSATFPSNVIYYPCNLMAPDSVAQADIHPIGCGPFKFVKWRRNDMTELVRFENYFETDDEGNSLPYLEGIIGRPKADDTVRLMALRAGEVDLIDNMAYSDAAVFQQTYGERFKTWHVPTLGTSFVLFNLDRGPFTDKRLRQAAALATNRDAIMKAVFFGRGDTAKGFYAPMTPWFQDGITPYPEYDPDKAKALLREARAVGTEIDLVSLVSYHYMKQTGELLQAMWNEVGFRVRHSILDSATLKKKRRDRDFHAESAAASYRFDPDGWFSRQILSTSPSTQETSGFRHEKADSLILEARQTGDIAKRLDLYAAVESIVNEELPLLYVHHLTMLSAGVSGLHGYEPAISGPFSTRGAGIRSAWLA